MSFKPLFALLMAFLECDVFFFGTASKNGGSNSRIDCHAVGSVQPADARGKSAAERDVAAAANSGCAKGTLNAGSSVRAVWRGSAAIVVEKDERRQCNNSLSFPSERLSPAQPQTTTTTMFRLTRPLFNQVRKTTTGITGLNVHPNPLPALATTYESTLSALAAFPKTSVYRQGVEALTQRKLSVVQSANGDIAAVEKELDEGQIELSLDIAQDELNLVSKMAEWKACVCYPRCRLSDFLTLIVFSWEPLEEQPPAGQWEYPGRTSTASAS